MQRKAHQKKKIQNRIAQAASRYQVKWKFKKKWDCPVQNKIEINMQIVKIREIKEKGSQNSRENEEIVKENMKKSWEYKRMQK